MLTLDSVMNDTTPDYTDAQLSTLHAATLDGKPSDMSWPEWSGVLRERCTLLIESHLTANKRGHSDEASISPPARLIASHLRI